MARIRSIKPEFFTSIPVGGVSRDARLMFVGLWTNVDDDGRWVDDPRLVKAAVFPLDDDLTPVEIDRLLDELDAKGRIVRYEVCGRAYLQVCGWREHQKIDRRTPSKYPPPPLVEGSSNARRGLDEGSTNPRGLFDEGSSPDQDQDQDLDHQSLVTPGGDPRPVDNRVVPIRPATDRRRDRALQILVERRVAAARPRNPEAYRAKVVLSVEREHGAELDRLLRAYPRAPADVIASAALGENHSLGYYQETPT